MSLLLALVVVTGTAAALVSAVVPGVLVALLVSRTFADPVVESTTLASFTSASPNTTSGRSRAVRERSEGALDRAIRHS